MLLIWGKKTSVRVLGRVAEFCPICRAIGVFELLETRLVPHFYYIPLGRGRLAGNHVRCRRCATPLSVDAERYASVSQDKSADARALFPTLGPQAAAAIQSRQKLEERVLAGGLSPEERTELLEEPFLLLDSRLETRAAEGSLDRKSGTALAATIGVPLLLAIIEEHAPPSFGFVLGAAQVASVVVGLVATLYLFVTGHRRFYRGTIEPLLAGALAPLRPTREELLRALKKLKEIGRIIAERADVERLLAQTKFPARAKQ